MEPNTIYHNGRVIANHTYNKITGWSVTLSKELNDIEKAGYKKVIKKMAEEHKLKLWMDDEAYSNMENKETSLTKKETESKESIESEIYDDMENREIFLSKKEREKNDRKL